MRTFNHSDKPHVWLFQRIATLIVLVAGFLTAAETNMPALLDRTALQPVLDDQKTLGPGDRVTFRVIEDQDEPRSLVITDSGDLDVPYYGLVPAAGKTSRQLAEEIRKVLEKSHYHRATVILAVELVNKTRVLGKVYVAGYVRNAGSYDIPADERLTVSKVILKAGGFVEYSDQKQVRLVRRNGTKTTTELINVANIWKRGRIEDDREVYPDDLIIVSARLIRF